MHNNSILVVEDEAVVALDIKLQLEDMGYLVLGIAESGEQAIHFAREYVPSMALMDIRLKGSMDGIQAAEILGRDMGVAVVFLTSHSDSETVKRAAQTSPYGYLTKPFQFKELRAGIEVALTKARLERQLRESDRWFAATLKCVQDGVILTGLDGGVRFLNPVAEALTGWTADEAVGRNVSEVIQFEHQQKTRPYALPNAAVRALEEGRVVDVEHARQLQLRDHTKVSVDESAGPVEDDNGNRIGAVLILRDASERLRQEEQLRRSEQKFRDAFDNAPLGMALVSLDGRFIQVNAELCRLMGGDAPWLRAQSNSAITHPSDVDHEATRVHELMSGATPLVQFEKRYLPCNRQEPLCTLVSVSLMHDGGLSTCLLYQIQDLSDQKKAAEQLAEVAEQRIKLESREQTVRTKNDLLSRAGHEMRTPLNAILGFAQLLQEAQPRHAAEAQTFAGHIVTAGKHLLSMVNDVLALPQASEGVLSLNMASVRLDEMVNGVTQLLGLAAQVQNISFHMRIPPNLFVQADVIRLRQVLLNLSTNAMKYNRPGGSVTFIAEKAISGRVVLTIEDDGIGMTAEQMAHLFQPYDRMGREMTRIEGVGLGLVITRGLVEQMGGTIRFESQPRVGTRAIVEFEGG